MAITWNMRKLHLCTDSVTVYYWVSETLTGKARVKTKASSDMLIRRRLGTLKSLIEEYQLDLDVTLSVLSAIWPMCHRSGSGS